MNREIAKRFYGLVDLGIHPYQAFNMVAYENEQAVEDLFRLRIIAENLAADIINYPTAGDYHGYDYH